MTDLILSIYTSCAAASMDLVYICWCS